MSVYIKDMDMPTDCLACRIACDKENYGVIGRPPKCPLAEAAAGDLINRAEAIEAMGEEPPIVYDLETEWKEHDVWVRNVSALSALPSAEAVQGWIPCSERLPKRDELVLVTYKTTDRIHLCRYLDDGSENPWWSYIDDCCAWNNVVLAWMPLPKPYREDGE